ncbi:microtubule-associated protein RP/EB family member 2 [Striga asiatica]|uniref:Microtubule-associated protein RP/EB family member 2 n=1 Tax=Striga asiatica TaxID=4170 RepID=A0A5A7QRK4_STRAF|nr:microtubule-associated protein RP/EB family member 2 [Striga asiatica]
MNHAPNIRFLVTGRLRLSLLSPVISDPSTPVSGCLEESTARLPVVSVRLLPCLFVSAVFGRPRLPPPPPVSGCFHSSSPTSGHVRSSPFVFGCLRLSPPKSTVERDQNLSEAVANGIKEKGYFIVGFRGGAAEVGAARAEEVGKFCLKLCGDGVLRSFVFSSFWKRVSFLQVRGVFANV